MSAKQYNGTIYTVKLDTHHMKKLIKPLLIAMLMAFVPLSHAQSATAVALLSAAMIMSASDSKTDSGQAVPMNSDGYIEIDDKQWSAKATDSGNGRLRFCGGYFLTVNGEDRCRKPKQGFWNSLLNINRDAPSVPLDDHLAYQMPKNAEVLEAREYRNGTLRIYYELPEDSVD